MLKISKKILIYKNKRKLVFKNLYIYSKYNNDIFYNTINHFFYFGNYYFYTNKNNNFILNSFYKKSYSFSYLYYFKYNKHIFFMKYFKLLNSFVKSLKLILNLKKLFNFKLILKKKNLNN